MSPERFARMKRALDLRQPDLTVVMENVHKPHNFSAIVRSCEASGVPEAHAVFPKTISQHSHTAAGSNKWVKVNTYPDIQTPLAQLKAQGFQLLTAHLDEHSVDFRAVDYTKPTAVIMGSELFGISDEAAELADQSIVIPMLGLTESLNVSVATALILYEAQRQREATDMYKQCRIAPDIYERTLFEWSYPDIAKHCRSRGIPYPTLDENGFLPPKALG